MKKICLITFIGFCVASCSITSKIKKGQVAPLEFDEEIKFSTQKSVIIFPVKLNGIEKNFLFDTGADFNVIQRDSLLGNQKKYDGASNREMELGNEYTKSIKIGEVDFQNTYGVNGDLSGLKEQIPNFGGLIGQPIISKANWLIDYPNKSLRISNKDLADNSFTSVEIKREDGAPYTFITINEKRYKVIIDTGSTSDFNLPRESKLAEELLTMYSFQDNIKERYTLGGLQKITEKVGVVPEIKLGNLSFKDVKTNINVSSQPRIGMGFFKDCVIYIDNIEKNYKIKKIDSKE